MSKSNSVHIITQNYDEAAADEAGLLMGLGGGTRFHRGDPARSKVGSACASRGWPQ